MPQQPGQLNDIIFPLLDWFRSHARTLPWRSDPQPYKVWVSEIMLQQTRVAAVLGYFARFMEALPAVSDLARVEEEQLLKLWQGLGYYNRARNLQKEARQVMEDWGGAFPSRYEDILCRPDGNASQASQKAYTHRQIHHHPSLGDTRRRQVHRDSLGRQMDPEILERDADTFSGLPHFSAHKAYHVE